MELSIYSFYYNQLRHGVVHVFCIVSPPRSSILFCTLPVVHVPVQYWYFWFCWFECLICIFSYWLYFLITFPCKCSLMCGLAPVPSSSVLKPCRSRLCGWVWVFAVSQYSAVVACYAFCSFLCTSLWVIKRFHTNWVYSTLLTIMSG